MINKTQLSALSQFQSPLVEDSIYTFDATQDGSLTPRDFNKSTNWPEFVARYIATERTVRIQFIQKMSRNLKIELCWNLFQLWKDPDADKTTVRKISDILTRDFQVEVRKLTDYESVKWQVLRRKIETAFETEGSTGSDLVEGTGYSDFALALYGGISNPFEIGSLRLTPQIGGSAAEVSGKRTFRDKPDETYDTVNGKLSPYISVGDALNERWSLGGGGYYRYRPNPPKSFNQSEQSWNAYANLDSPFDWPLTAGIYADALNSFDAPPLLQGQNQTEKHSNSAGGYFTWNLSSRLALLSSVDYSSKDNTESYSKYRSAETTGSLFLKWRTLASFVRLGMDVSSEKTRQEKLMGGETRAQDSLGSTVWIGGEYFRFIDRVIGQESSVSAKLFLGGTSSQQEPNATYPAVSTTVSASTFLIPRKFFGKLSGNLSYAYIDHHEGPIYYESQTSYSLSPMLRWNFTENITLGISADASQTIDRAALQTRSTSLSSKLNLTMNFDVFRGLEVGAAVYASKNWDEDLKKGPGNYDNSTWGGGATATVSF